jgi:hypothetical protein
MLHAKFLQSETWIEDKLCGRTPSNIASQRVPRTGLEPSVSGHHRMTPLDTVRVLYSNAAVRNSKQDLGCEGQGSPTF